MAIVLTCCYESIISSYLTVPPQEVVLSSLKDLYGLGYRILLDLLEIFKMNALSSTINVNDNSDIWSYIEIFLNGRPKEELYELLSYCNVSYSKVLEELMEIQEVMKSSFPEVKCYVLKNDAIYWEKLFVFTGLLRYELGKTMELFRESGILGMFYDFDKYVKTFQTRRKQELRAEEDGKPFAFQVVNWKILSVFLAWASLVLLALGVFLVEIHVPNVLKLLLIHVRALVSPNNIKRVSIWITYLLYQSGFQNLLLLLNSLLDECWPKSRRA